MHDHVKQLIAVGLAVDEAAATKLVNSLQGELTARLIIANAVTLRLDRELAEGQVAALLKQHLADFGYLNAQALLDVLQELMASGSVLCIQHICEDYASTIVSSILDMVEREQDKWQAHEMS